MDFHPILEKGDLPSSGLWYVISSPNAPSPRLGTACTCSKTSKENCNMYVIGGADPSTLYNEVYKFDVDKFSWSHIKPAGFSKRYEHCAMTSSENSDKIYLFGGADLSENFNSTQVFHKTSKKCEDVECEGHTPKARTLHSAATNGYQLFVWGGGHKGAEPVSDLSLHILDVKTSTWNRHRLKDDVPSARFGHALELVNDKLYIHGGMANTTLHDELFSIDLLDYSSKRMKPTGSLPSARAGHSTCSYNQHMLIFGGLMIEGVSNEMFQYSTVSNQWSLLNFDSPPPTPRLDHSTVVTYLRCKTENSVEEAITQSSRDTVNASSRTNHHQEEQPPASGDSVPNIIPVDLWETSGGDALAAEVNQAVERLTLAEENSSNDDELSEGGELVPVFMVFGGMDTSGNVYNDLLVTRLDQLITS